MKYSERKRHTREVRAALRQIVAAGGVTFNQLARATGVDSKTIARCAKGGRVLQVRNVEKLLPYVRQRLAERPAATDPSTPPPALVLGSPAAPASKMIVGDDVECLSDIGPTVQYRGVEVVAADAVASWCGRETRQINEAIRKLASRDAQKVVEGRDYFELTAAECADLSAVLGDGVAWHPGYGVMLITMRGVNMLSHYFRDPKSVARSNRVTDIGTWAEQRAAQAAEALDPSAYLPELYESISAITRITDESRRTTAALVQGLQALGRTAGAALASHASELAHQGERVERFGAELAKVAEVAQLTHAEQAETRSELDHHRGASRMSADEMKAVNDAIAKRVREYGLKRVDGLIRRALKSRYLEHATKGTYADIASRHVPAMLADIAAWKPTTPSDFATLERERAERTDT